MLDIHNELEKPSRIFQAIIFVIMIVVFFANAEVSLAVTVDSTLTTTGAVLGPVGNAISLVLGVIAYMLTGVIGLLITVVVALLIQVAQFSNIINVPTVITGWVIVRDLCNMSFILILLIIAFATILRQENFSAKKMLPKLLLMAILINFSRSIFGLLIDISQIVMLTFVNAFSAGGGWFIEAFRVDKWYSINSWSGSGSVSSWSTTIAIIAGVLAAIITLIVMSVMLAVLVARIVMLWIYTIFSPLIFLGFAFTPLQKYTGKLWEDFTKQLVVGPVLAFFIWLALTTASSSSKLMGATLDPSQEVCAGIGAFFCQGNLQNFIIVIGLLMGGLMVAQQMGGAAGSIAGKGLDWAKKSIRGAGQVGGVVGAWGARKVKMGAVSELLAQKKVTKVLGADGKWTDKVSWQGRGRIPGLGGLASALYGLELRPTKMVEGIKEGLKSKSEREEAQGIGASAVSLKKGGIGGLIKGLGVSRDLTEAIAGPGGFLWHKGFKRAYKATIGGGQGNMEAKEKELDKMKSSRGVTQAEYKQKETENKENEDRYKEDSRRKHEEMEETKQKRDNAAQLGDNTKAAELNVIWLKQRTELDEMRNNQRQARANGVRDLGIMKGKIVKDDVRKKQDKYIDGMEKDLKLRKPIQTFYADRARDELISKASHTLGDNDNEEFLVDAFQDAIINGNKEVAQAVMIHAASVGHLNEIIQGYKSKENVYDDSGKLLVKAGEALCQGGYGLNALVKQALIEDLGIDEQTAYAAQSEASTQAKGVKHANLSESVGSSNGLLFQRKVEGEGGQQYRARGEARKVDAERFLRDYNRLAWGDEFDTVGGRKFQLNALGLDNFTELAASIDQEVNKRGRFNKNAAMNISNDAQTLRDWAKKLEVRGVHYFDNGEQKSYVKLADDLIKYGQSIAQAQRRDSVGGGINVKALQDEVLRAQKKPV